MKPSRAALLLLLLLVAGCGGGAKPSAPDDVTLRQDARAGHLAFSLQRPEEAARQYGNALVRAQARDDAAAIGDYGYDLAVAQLAANQPERALASARMTRTELARRGRTAFPELYLVEATALYRTGAKQAADRLAQYVQEIGNETVAARAAFLHGLIADEMDNVAGLNTALVWLQRHQTTSESTLQRADLDELLARYDLRQGGFADAVVQAELAADLRRTERDYRGMARALALAGDAAARANDRQMAANLYIRAGQSAAAQGDAAAARPWLRRALALDSDPTLQQTARRALAALQVH